MLHIMSQSFWEQLDWNMIARGGRLKDSYISITTIMLSIAHLAGSRLKCRVDSKNEEIIRFQPIKAIALFFYCWRWTFGSSNYSFHVLAAASLTWMVSMALPVCLAKRRPI
ncbi:hypothetical protein BJ166DRAFT_68094 [Pestalotiopsis sp. NC0098]|nr:hypothetical protein BJ166DRAFT_68094 [Pestalotiopsis sp. NC0098]